jgi:hypothetical protein
MGAAFGLPSAHSRAYSVRASSGVMRHIWLFASVGNSSNKAWMMGSSGMTSPARAGGSAGAR